VGIETLKTNNKQGFLNRNQTTYEAGNYDCFPAFKIGDGEIVTGYDFLADSITESLLKGLRVLVIDGFQGVDWQAFVREMREILAVKKVDVDWIDMSAYYSRNEEIEQKIAPFIVGDDRIFGKHYPFGPEVFFDAKKIADLRINISILRGKKSGELTIVYGTGAGLVELWDQLWYLDYPKDLSQNDARNGRAINLAEGKNLSFETSYKRSYFIEWPALNRHKRNLQNHIDLFIDAQDISKPASISGPNFRKALHELSETPFRVRPWFFPGPWGGKFMQGHMRLDPQQPNFAWSFELIVPENGIILQSGKNRLEFSFDFLMFQETQRVLGKTASQQFKYEWPIRFDYLDTVDGGNLSTQVHPRPDYIRREFGETYTQDEAYYIIAAKPDARVYLGLTEDCDPDEFRKALEISINEGKELDIDKYVNSEPSKPHDLFLIPNGTVHCSGAGNLVLEISATPYIFTFKIYDYLRRDLDGNLRPINIDRGFANVRTERRKSWVQQNLLAKPKLIAQKDGWKEELLYDKPFTFYKIHRVEFGTTYKTDTKDRALTVNLVAGETVEVHAENGRSSRLNYIETMIIPAATGEVTFENKGSIPCTMVLVYVKENIGITTPLNDPQDG
jgi:mannose-6-phosphate isomerase class I